MPSLRDIKRHMRSVQGLEQMTHALAQVAAARARRYRQGLREIAPYAQGLERAMSLVMLRHGLQHPLLWVRPVLREVIVVIGSERGLCGAHNAEVARAALELVSTEAQQEFLAVGTRLADVLTHEGISPGRTVPRPRWGTAEEIAPLADELTAGYLGGRFQRVTIVGHHRDDTGRRTIRPRVLLPVRAATDPLLARLSPEIEPDSIVLMAHVIPRLIMAQLRMACLHAMAIEEETRAVAMQTAKSNAQDLRGRLMRLYRRARQERITRELLEVVAAPHARAHA